MYERRNTNIQLKMKPGAIKRIEISPAVYISHDELFVSKARFVVERHMAEFEFNVDKFAKQMATSQSTLYRKLSALVDLSPGEYIQQIRLRHAEQMLKQKAGNVTSIAYAVGFNDAKYFSRCFKRYCGDCPSDILKKQFGSALKRKEL